MCCVAEKAVATILLDLKDRMTQVSEWGPHLWKVLHSYAERAGAYKPEAQMVDEIRTWIKVLRVTEGVLPCAMCRNHYRAWRTKHPIDSLLFLRADSFKEELRKWLWGLHNQVNAMREIPELPYEELSTMYADVTQQDIQQSLSTLVKLLEKAILHRQVNSNYVGEWRRAVALLRVV